MKRIRSVQEIAKAIKESIRGEVIVYDEMLDGSHYPCPYTCGEQCKLPCVYTGRCAVKDVRR